MYEGQRKQTRGSVLYLNPGFSLSHTSFVFSPSILSKLSLILSSVIPLKGTQILRGLVNMRVCVCVCVPAYACPLTAHWSVCNAKRER